MARHVVGLALVTLFGLSLTVPCLAMGITDERPMEPMAGCATGEFPRSDHVCESSFAKPPSPDALRPIPLAGTVSPSSPVRISIGSRPPDRHGTANPPARGHAPPAYLLHAAFLI